MSFVAILALLALFALVITFGVMFKWKGWKIALITTGRALIVFIEMIAVAVVVIINSMGN
jgi:hypothetical protein